MHAARKTTRNWNLAWEHCVNELRASPALRHQMGRSHVHRTAIGITRALVAKVRVMCLRSASRAARLTRCRVARRRTTRFAPSCPRCVCSLRVPCAFLPVSDAAVADVVHIPAA